MAITTFDPSTDQPEQAQLSAEAEALAQGEKIAQAQEEDRLRKYQQSDNENANVSLIAGKFKSQEELLKAYKELESKLGKKSQDDDEDASEEPTEATQSDSEQAEDVEEQPASEAVDYMSQLGEEYAKTGTISDEAIERLSQMDQKELIQSYLQYYQKSAAQSQQVQLQAEQINAIKESVGGDAAYGEMMTWAAQNLSPEEINDYNTVTGSGNPVAIRFAVQALQARYQRDEGYEAPLVTGKKADTGLKPYRSQAELARDIANPLYHADPAFRADVEERLARSTNLL
jgi:hypothetical protein